MLRHSQPANPFRAVDDPHPEPVDAGDDTDESSRLLAHFQSRLRSLGATPEEVEAVAGTWDSFDEDWTVEHRREVALDWDDAQLARDIIESRRAGLSDDDLLAAEAERQSAGTIEAVLAWVGESPQFAAAVLEIERARPKPRVTLVAALEELTSGGS